MEFTYETSETGSCMVRTTVKNTEDDTKTTYYLHVGTGIISVGHGMCSGAFTPKKGIKYELEFSLIDASWNEGETATCTLVYNPKNAN
jgi:hypothetical protein